MCNLISFVEVPSIAWWPGKIAPGSVAENFTSSLDLLPTLVSYSGGELPKGVILDGQSISAVLEGATDHGTAYAESKPLFYYRGPKLMAAKQGPFKVHFVTHSGFGNDNFLYHDPSLLFIVEVYYCS